MKYNLDFHGMRVQINPDKDLCIIKTPRNPCFLQDKQLKGVDLYVRKSTHHNFFYTLSWDLTSEELPKFHILSRDEARNVATHLKENDYLGITMDQKVRYNLTWYGLQ